MVYSAPDGDYRPPGPVHVHAPADTSKPYSYAYGVSDDYSKTNFNAAESGDENGSVVGSYSVSLPDGRTQHVRYTADDYNGYVADVSYEGSAVYPDLNIVKPHPGHAPNRASVPARLPAPVPLPPRQFAPAPTPVFSPAPSQVPVFNPAPLPPRNFASAPNRAPLPTPNFAPSQGFAPLPNPNFAPAPIPRPNFAPGQVRAPLPNPNFAPAPLPNPNFAPPRNFGQGPQQGFGQPPPRNFNLVGAL